MNSNMTTSSPLLALAGEIRNNIYDYALTEPHPITHYVTPSGHSRFLRCDAVLDTDKSYLIGDFFDLERHAQFIMQVEGVAAQECNQLKYVCRQLRYETLGYELKCNDISFIQPNDDDDDHEPGYVRRCNAR